MKEYLKRYSDENPERFNKEFIYSRDKTDILEYVKDIFKSLEILGNFRVLDVYRESDESQMKPIINGDRYYKPIERSRLDKIVYKVEVIPSYANAVKPILQEDDETPFDPKKAYQITSKRDPKDEEAPVIVTKELYINKLIDNCFFYNEGIRYFLIYQIVDNATYGTRNAVSLKSLLMPINVSQIEQRRPVAPVWPDISTFNDEESKVFSEMPSYRVMLFKKRINPMLYVFGKYAFNSLVTMDMTGKDPNAIIDLRMAFRDESIFDRFNRFFGTNILFSKDGKSLEKDGWVVFNISGRDENACYIAVEREKLVGKDQNLMSVIGSLMDLQSKDERQIAPSFDDFATPWFWIEKLSAFFTANNDPVRKFEKTQTMLLSLERLMDDATRRTLTLEDEDKKNTLAVIRYIMRNFSELSESDSQDLANKRIRLYEYQLYPLRSYLSSQIYRIINSSTRTREVLLRVFANLKPMYIVKKTVTNELLRYYNSSNDFNLFSAFLKATFRGPQSINNNVSMQQRDLHPSYVGRISLIGSSASDPGMAFSLTPFVKLYDGYFAPQKK